MFEKIYILWLRQLKRYWRSKPRVIGSLGQPLLFLLALGYGMGAVFQQAGKGDYLDFLAPGIIGMSIIFTAIFSGIEIIWDRQFGFLKEVLVAPMSRLEIMIGHTLGGATVAFLQGVVVLLLSIAVGFGPIGWIEIFPALGIMFLTALLFAGFGVAVASRLNDMQGFQLIMNFLIMPLFFLSGALFPLEGAPKMLLAIAAIDPLSYGVDALRGLLTGSYYYGLPLDIAALAGAASLAVAAGSYLFSKIQI
jgi:ABC-2 type transport system permease protein